MNILLVEDDPGVGRLLNRGLVAEGYDVRWLKAGREVRSSLADGAFAAAILDLGLPDMDGADLCRALRAEGIDTPICMLTARASLEDKLEGFACGADDYIAKPFAFEELLVRLAALIRRSEAARGQIITVGRLMIDVRARQATVGAHPVALSRREFDVLLCLARKAGQVATRDEIRASAWGADSAVTENAVDVYVGYVRRRLQGHAGAPTVHTVRGAGFRLDR